MKPKTKRVLKGAAKGAAAGALREVFTKGAKRTVAATPAQMKAKRAAAFKTAGKVAIAAGTVAAGVIAARAVMRSRKGNSSKRSKA